MSKANDTAYVKNFKRRITKKVKDVVEEANEVSKALEELASKLDEKSRVVLEENSLSANAYKDFYDYLENISDKLFTALNIITPLCDEALDVNESVSESECSPLVGDGCSSAGTSEIVDQYNIQPIPNQEHLAESASSEKSDDQLECERRPSLLNSQLKPDVFSQSFEKKLDSVPCCSGQNRKENSEIHQKILSDSSYYSVSSHSQLENPSDSNINFSQNFDERFSSVSYDTSLPLLCPLPDHLQTNISSPSSQKDVAEFLTIPEADVTFGSEYSAAVVTSLISPSDFWVQLKTPDESKILFNLDETSPLLQSEQSRMRYFLAPSSRSQKYERARLLEFYDTSEITQEDSAEVLFVDFGFTENVQVCALRIMPITSVDYPIQAIQCKLYGVLPMEEDWSESAIEEFRNLLQYSDPQVTVISKCNEQYQVEMTVTIHLPECIETENVADMLCFLGHARRITDCDNKLMIPARETSNAPDNSENVEQFLYQSSSDTHNVTQYSPVSFNRQNHLNTNYTFENMQQMNTVVDNTDILSRLSYQERIQSEEDLAQVQGSSKQNDYHSSSVSSASSGAISNTVATSEGKTLRDTKILNNKTHTPFDWTLTISDAQPIYVTQNTSKYPVMMIGICAVENPHHFYANVVSDNLVELDDLREQMTQFYKKCYSNAQKFKTFQLEADELEPGMFCSCRYEIDENWYRARIDAVVLSEESGLKKIKVHYVDYGEQGLLDPEEVYPLTPKFAVKPAFALPCSLAGIFPRIPGVADEIHDNYSTFTNDGWSLKAIEIFEALTKKGDKCFVAEVAGEKMLRNGRSAFDIYLWDNINGKDYMINDILIDEGYAFLDVALKHDDANKHHSKSIEDLKSWDPMSEDYNNDLNSYGVDIDDLEVQTMGHKANDEKVFCKFFSRNGRCFRGENCPYVHTYENLGDGETRDKVNVFLADNQISLPEPGSRCLVQISFVIDPGHFYMVFPYGTCGVLDRPRSIESHKREFELLQENMMEFYSQSSFDDNTAIALAYGTIVVAKSKFDGHWYRARITDVEDVNKPVEVFFVDYGGMELVSRKDIRKIKQEYLYCPFQAVESFLIDVVPKDKRWSQHAMTTFTKAVESKVFLAHIKEKIGSALYVVLKGTSKPNDIVINDMLISHGFASRAPPNDIFQSFSCGGDTADKKRRGACSNPSTQPG